MESLRGKAVVVTGASSGIGRAVAVAFAREGARVALAARRAAELAEVEAECRAAGGEAFGVPTDVADRAAVEALFARTVERFGGVDILVAAAGINVKNRAYAGSSPEDWERIADVNILGVHWSCHAALAPMRARGGGLMILVGSIAAVRTTAAAGAAYTASKHAVVGLARGIAAEEQAHGIRVTVVHPGLVNTPILQQRPVPPPPAVLEAVLQPSDVAETCLYLARLHPRATVAELTLEPTVIPG